MTTDTFYDHADQQAYYDKEDYSVLLEALDACKDITGLGCEVGVREGHGSYLMMKHSPEQRCHVCIDPYGNIEYKSWEVRCDRLNQYDDAMFYNAMVRLYSAAIHLERHLVFYPLEDNEFQTRFDNGVPIYTKNEKRVMGTYAMVHLDGPHTTQTVLNETQFFVKRMERGGCVVYDDIQQYQHGVVDTFLTQHDFKCIRKTDKKAAYQRG